MMRMYLAKRGKTYRALLPALFAVGLFGAESPGDLQDFVSVQAGYAAHFPKSWHVLEPTMPTLYISSFPPFRAARAVIVPENGATISIVPPPEGVSGIKDWINRDSGPRGGISRAEIQVLNANSKSTLPITEIVRESIDGPDTVSWYFEFSGHLLKANLTYWSGDHSAGKYRQVLRNIVQTLTPIKN
jgi:hypothetical protein